MSGGPEDAVRELNELVTKLVRKKLKYMPIVWGAKPAAHGEYVRIQCDGMARRITLFDVSNNVVTVYEVHDIKRVGGELTGELVELK